MSRCSVCLSPFEKEEETFALECAHVYHRACIRSCVEYEMTKCPVCQRDLSMEFRKELCPEVREREEEDASWFRTRCVRSRHRVSKLKEVLRTRNALHRAVQRLRETGEVEEFFDKVDAVVDESVP